MKALAPNGVLFLVLCALLMLTGDGEDVVLDLDLDLLGLDPGRSARTTRWPSSRTNVDCRGPRALATIQPLVEHAINPRTQLTELGERVPTRQCSGRDSPPFSIRGCALSA